MKSSKYPDKYKDYVISEEIIKRENDNAFSRRTPIDWNESMHKMFDDYEKQVDDIKQKLDDREKATLHQRYITFMKNYFETYKAYITHKANNPSWAVTGRGGRSASKDAKAMSKYDSLMLKLNSLTDEFKKTLDKYKAIARNKEKEAIKQAKDAYIAENPIKDFPFKLVEKEVPSLTGTAIKKVPTLNGYYISKDWGSYKVYDPSNKIVYSGQTKETQAQVKEWLVYYLYTKGIDAKKVDTPVDYTKTKKVVTNVIREDDNYRLIEKNGAFTIQTNTDGKWKIFKESDMSFSRLPVEKAKVYYAKLMQFGSITSFKAQMAAKEDVKNEIDRLFPEIEPKQDLREKLLQDATGTKPTLSPNDVYVVDTIDSSNVHSSVKLSNSILGGVVSVIWQKSDEEFSNFCRATDIFAILRKDGFEMKTARKVGDKFLFSKMIHYKDINQLTINDVIQLQKESSKVAVKVNEILMEYNRGNYNDTTVADVGSARDLTSIIKLETLTSELRGYSNIVQTNTGYLIVKENNHLSLQCTISNTTNKGDIDIYLKYMNDVEKIKPIYSELTGMNKIVSELGLKYNSTKDCLSRQAFTYDSKELAYSDLIIANIKSFWSTALDYYENANKIIKDDLDLISKYVPNKDPFEDIVRSIINAEYIKTGSGAIQFNDVPIGDKTKLKLKVVPSKLLATLYVDDVNLLDARASGVIHEELLIMKSLGFKETLTTTQGKFILSEKSEMTEDKLRNIWEDILNAATTIDDMIEKVGRSVETKDTMTYETSEKVIERSGRKIILQTETFSGTGTTYIMSYTIVDETGDIKAISSNNNLGSSLDIVLSRVSDLEYLLEREYYKSISVFLDKLSSSTLDKNLRDARNDENNAKAEAFIEDFKVRQDRALSELRKIADEKQVPIFIDIFRVYVGLPTIDIASVKSTKIGEAVYRNPNLLKIAKASELNNLFHVAIAEGSSELLPEYVKGLPPKYSTLYLGAYNKAIDYIDSYTAPAPVKKYELSSKLILNIDVYDDYLEGRVELEPEDVTEIWDMTGKTYPGGVIVMKGKNRVDLVEKYRNEFNLLKVTGSMSIGEVEDRRVKLKNTPYENDPTIVTKIKGFEHNKAKSDDDIHRTMIGDDIYSDKLKDYYKDREVDTSKRLPAKRSEDDIRSAERVAKLALVKDPYQREQLIRLAEISTRLVSKVDADNTFNSFFLEEPKEFKKYKLPTVALALTCYDLSLKHDDLKKTDLHKLFSRAKGIVVYGRWFSTTDPDGNPCKMSIWVDREFEKKAIEDKSDELKALKKFARYTKLHESIGDIIDYNGNMAIVESVNFDKVTLYDGSMLFEQDLDDIEESTQVSAVDTGVKGGFKIDIDKYKNIMY